MAIVIESWLRDHANTFHPRKYNINKGCSSAVYLYISLKSSTRSNSLSIMLKFTDREKCTRHHAQIYSIEKKGLTDTPQKRLLIIHPSTCRFRILNTTTKRAKS
jgi:hypothetical protein